MLMLSPSVTAPVVTSLPKPLRACQSLAWGHRRWASAAPLARAPLVLPPAGVRTPVTPRSPPAAAPLASCCRPTPRQRSAAPSSLCFRGPAFRRGQHARRLRPRRSPARGHAPDGAPDARVALGIAAYPVPRCLTAMSFTPSMFSSRTTMPQLLPRQSATAAPHPPPTPASPAWRARWQRSAAHAAALRTPRERTLAHNPT